MDKLSQVVEKYTKNPTRSHFRKPAISISARINPEAKIKLEVISSLFGKKQTPLLAEIIETSINEIFNQVDVTEDLMEEFRYKIKKEES
ncbi:MAG: hypothetical protein D3924_06115 [Candidatus Electrothrix sp. AR4]|nr:hypothetical protein [Candidatus Electrothrix sp. AR4]